MRTDCTTMPLKVKCKLLYSFFYNNTIFFFVPRCFLPMASSHPPTPSPANLSVPTAPAPISPSLPPSLYRHGHSILASTNVTTPKPSADILTTWPTFLFL